MLELHKRCCIVITIILYSPNSIRHNYKHQLFRNSMNLFLPVVDESRMHPHFKSIYSNPIYQPQREVVAEWANGFVDRDNKFVYEFQTTFNSSFWELYLFALFKQFHDLRGRQIL